MLSGKEKKLEELIAADKKTGAGLTRSQRIDKDLKELESLIAVMLDESYPISKILNYLNASGVSIKKHQTLSKKLKSLFPDHAYFNRSADFEVTAYKVTESDLESVPVASKASDKQLKEVRIKKGKSFASIDQFKKIAFGWGTVHGKYTNIDKDVFFQKHVTQGRISTGEALNGAKWIRDFNGKGLELAKSVLAARSVMSEEEFQAWKKVAVYVSKSDGINVVFPA